MHSAHGALSVMDLFLETGTFCIHVIYFFLYKKATRYVVFLFLQLDDVDVL